jgi:indole-3-glycerol phosphate synthase
MIESVEFCTSVAGMTVVATDLHDIEVKTRIMEGMTVATSNGRDRGAAAQSLIDSPDVLLEVAERAVQAILVGVDRVA